MDRELSGGGGGRQSRSGMIQRKRGVRYLPFDRVTRVPPGTTLFSAAHWIGLPIDSTCGGRGPCGKRKVRVGEGKTEAAGRAQGAPEITTADHRLLRPVEIAEG